MLINKAITVYALTFLLKASNAVDDLLEQYVKHVGLVNSVNYNDQHHHHHQHSKYQRKERSHGDTVFNFGANRKLNNFIGVREKRDVGDVNEDLNQWTHWEFLDDQKNVLLRWQTRHQEILFRVEARTLGYVGIGFSPNGGMEGADITIGWVDDSGKASFLDCHGASKSQGSLPIKDEHDNYTLMKGAENGTHTILEFRRALDTCDTEDFVLNSDTVRVIWALHDRDPSQDSDMIYHGENRGSQSLHLFGPPPVTQNEDPMYLRTWDVTLKNFEIRSTMNTIYWCKIFKAPTLQHKHHIIGYEPIIGKNHTGNVHHMLLHECEINGLPNTGVWEQYAKEDGRDCYTPDMPEDWERCTTPAIAWAIGSKGENFPKHVGLPLDNDKVRYYMLEVHFDNPTMKRSKDTSGIRLRYTRNLRMNDGGIIATGISPHYLHVIPPGQKEYKSVGYCSTDCTRQIFPKDGVNVVSVLLHSHLAGKKLKLRHLRGNKELAPLVQDDHYDFNYQQSRSLTHEIKVLPGDSLITECTYSTADREKPTLGGYATSEEMCLAFILHYPKTELAGCYSMPPVKYFFETLGVQEFYNTTWTELEDKILRTSSETSTTTPSIRPSLFTYKPGDENSPEANARAILAIQNAKAYTIDGETNGGSTPFEKLIIKEPQEFQNKTFMAHLESMPYKEVLFTKKMEEYFHTGLHLTFCRKRDDTLAIREYVERFPNFTEFPQQPQTLCSYRNRATSSSSQSLPLVYLPLYLLPIFAVLFSMKLDLTYILCTF